MSEAAAPARVRLGPAGHTFLERILDGIERAGNKMPDPAILFLVLCGVVIVVSQILSWFGRQGHLRGRHACRPVATEQTYYGGSTEPVGRRADEPEPATDYKVKTETAKVKGLLTVDGVRFLFTSFVATSGTSRRSRSSWW